MKRFLCIYVAAICLAVAACEADNGPNVEWVVQTCSRQGGKVSVSNSGNVAVVTCVLVGAEPVPAAVIQTPVPTQ